MKKAIVNKNNEGNMYKTQKDWIVYWNDKKTAMFSAPDQYRVFKGDDVELQASLRQDMKKRWITSGSQIKYEQDSLNAVITHYVGSKWAYSKKVKVPVFDGDFEQNADTEAYLQALFDTKDKLPEILKVMEKMADGKKIRLWTPDLDDRERVRSVDFSYDNFVGGFDVGGGGWFDYDGGLSRGVSVVKKNSEVTQ